MRINLTAADINALDSVYRRAEDDWQTYYQSGHGRNDFPSLAEWRQHIRTVNADLQRVRKLLHRASAASRESHSHSTKGQTQ